MSEPVDEQVGGFYSNLYNSLFSDRFAPEIPERLRRREVLRRIDEAADASCQSLTRLFLNEKLSQGRAAEILAGYAPLASGIKLDHVASANISPDSLASDLLALAPLTAPVSRSGDENLYRLGLYTIAQVLLMVGPVMVEWRKIKFSSTFELPRRVVNRLNQISEKFSGGSPTAVDEGFELTYRDYLMTRFRHMGVGTVRMTTQMEIDVRELFVMPRARIKPVAGGSENGPSKDAALYLDLATARRFLTQNRTGASTDEKADDLVELVMRNQRVVLIGLPGSGKSTFLEWLQLQLAAVDLELTMAGEQALPILMRARELDPNRLPSVTDLLLTASGNRDLAASAPRGWLDRQLNAGRVLFMLDGLDEIDPNLRDQTLLPWLADLCNRYGACRFLVSSRPVGYPPGTLANLDFSECLLLDFEKDQVGEYAKHWCTAVRLAQDELEEQARREGAAEGELITHSFESNAYIRDLARNPLMLSAICLVNYFERGTLPDDRAMLYGMCVEGLLHHWDHRRGIRSEFGLEEKLRVCRELAITMQSSDRAEYEVEHVLQVFTRTLTDEKRAGKLLEYVRYRTGLLLERRHGVFAFAHLTFQEYLAAQAIVRGNLLNIEPLRIVAEHDDPRWREVLGLYCGIAPAREVRSNLEALIQQPNTLLLGEAITDAFLSSIPEIRQDAHLRHAVIERVARAPYSGYQDALSRLPAEEVAPSALAFLATVEGNLGTSGAFEWLRTHPTFVEVSPLLDKLDNPDLTSVQLCELIYLLHECGDESTLSVFVDRPQLYDVPGPSFPRVSYTSQAEIALMGLSMRTSRGEDVSDALLFTVLDRTIDKNSRALFAIATIFQDRSLPQDKATWTAWLEMGRTLARNMSLSEGDPMHKWLNSLQAAIREQNPKPKLPKRHK